MISAARDRLPALEHLWLLDADLPTLIAGGEDVSAEDLTARTRSRSASRHRHRDLHIGHHRAAQGLRADAREPAVRGQERVHGPARHHPRGGHRLHAAVPAARARLRPDHRGRHPRGGHRARAHPRHDRPAARPGVLPAHVRARRAARVREGVQRRRGQGDRRRQGQDLRAGRAGRGLLQRVARLLAPRRPWPAGAARPVRPPRLRQAPRRARRQGRVRDLRRRGARAAARAFLPRHRRLHPRGLRADRDHRAGVGEPARPAEDRFRRPAAARRRGADRRRRRGPGPRQVRLPRATGATRRRPRTRSPTTAGTPPGTSASSTTRAT